jgi:C1A family cysteine protease
MTKLNFDITSNEFNPGYAIELEDRDYLDKTSVQAVTYSFANLPERVDPRQTDLYKKNWLQVEDQGQIGSCQGQSLTECGEFCYGIETGRVIQLSRMYAYIRSQMFDNIRTDSGSTLSGGTKCAIEGICLEEIAKYTSRYPGWNWLTQSMRDAAKDYILKSHTTIKSEEEVKSFIGSGLGIVQIGISWGREMTPDSNGCIKSFSGSGGGGHAVVFCGYVPDSDIGCRSSKGYHYLLKNSWSSRWGKGGFAYVDPSAVASMLRHRWTVMIGRSDMGNPTPRPVHVDFTKKGNSING